jgi:Putative Actinobacterial Holin-X, holin superfamily III
MALRFTPERRSEGRLGIRPSEPARAPQGSSLVEAAKNAAEDLVDLLTAQIKLARVELSSDLHRILKYSVRIFLFLPPVLVGYAFAMAGAASWLSQYWGRSLALVAVAGVQLLVGGVGLAWTIASLGRVRVLERAGIEAADSVQRTLAAVSADETSPDA